MGFVKSLLWSLCCIGFGIGLATVEVDGRTPVDHAKWAWRRKVNPSQLDQLKDSLGNTVDDVRGRLEAAGKEKDTRPRERHSAEDREAINKIIAKRAGSK